MSLYKKPNFSS